MTQYRNDPNRLSNWFDHQLRGVGHRGSSFSDIDGYVHDKRTDGILIMEFKWDGEAIPEGQSLALKALARKPDFTVWGLKRLDDDRVKAFEISSNYIAVITVEQLRAWFTALWRNTPISLRDLLPSAAPATDGEHMPMLPPERTIALGKELTAADIPFGGR